MTKFTDVFLLLGSCSRILQADVAIIAFAKSLLVEYDASVVICCDSLATLKAPRYIKTTSSFQCGMVLM